MFGRVCCVCQVRLVSMISFLLFRVATLDEKVTLGAEMGEEMALRVLAAQILQIVQLAFSNSNSIQIGPLKLQ